METNEEIDELKRINSYLIQLVGAGLAAERRKHESKRMIHALYSSLGKMKKLSQNAGEKLNAEILNLENIIKLLASALAASDREISIKYSGLEKDLDIKPVVNNSLLILEHELNKCNIQVAVIGESFVIRMPEGALMQVITNIVANSIRALNLCSPEIKLIKIILEQSHRTIFICDNGNGILPKHQDKIFQLFFTTNENQGGKGIGLHLVKELLEKRNYSITLADPSEHTELLNGACFKITF